MESDVGEDEQTGDGVALSEMADDRSTRQEEAGHGLGISMEGETSSRRIEGSGRSSHQPHSATVPRIILKVNPQSTPSHERPSPAGNNTMEPPRKSPRPDPPASPLLSYLATPASSVPVGPPSSGQTPHPKEGVDLERQSDIRGLSGDAGGDSEDSWDEGIDRDEEEDDEQDSDSDDWKGFDDQESEAEDIGGGLAAGTEMGTEDDTDLRLVLPNPNVHISTMRDEVDASDLDMDTEEDTEKQPKPSRRTNSTRSGKPVRQRGTVKKPNRKDKENVVISSGEHEDSTTEVEGGRGVKGGEMIKGDFAYEYVEFAQVSLRFDCFLLCFECR